MSISDAPLIIFKEKTLKKSGEIATKQEVDVDPDVDEDEDEPSRAVSEMSFDDTADTKYDDDDDDFMEEDVEETITPAIIVNTAKAAKPNSKSSSRKKKGGVGGGRSKVYVSPYSSKWSFYLLSNVERFI